MVDTTACEPSARQPDLVIALDAGDRTADAARYCVGTIARPAPSTRRRAELLTGVLLTRAGSEPASADSSPIELRVWSRAEPARVELAGPAQVVGDAARSDRGARLLEEHADSWGVEREGDRARVWFEIRADRVQAPEAPAELAAQPV
jgi:hypothetical protein